MVLNLNELDNTNNLKNGSPSNTLLTYHVTSHNNSTHFEPYAPQCRRLKGTDSLTLRIKHTKNKIMTNGPATTVVLQKGK